VKIGIISDTHKKVGRSKKVIDLLKEHGAQQIIHAGDIVKQEILDLLEESMLPYIAVYGNNDAHLYRLNHEYNLVEEPYHFSLGDRSVALMHHPTYISYDRDIVIYGHTHNYDARLENATLILNPGESCARDKPISECMLLHIKPKSYDVSYFHRAIKTERWIEKKQTFKRVS
jgi:putative phosphoesterase